jgi:hypothetical protein
MPKPNLKSLTLIPTRQKDRPTQPEPLDKKKIDEYLEKHNGEWYCETYTQTPELARPSSPSRRRPRTRPLHTRNLDSPMLTRKSDTDPEEGGVRGGGKVWGCSDPQSPETHSLRPSDTQSQTQTQMNPRPQTHPDTPRPTTQSLDPGPELASRKRVSPRPTNGIAQIVQNARRATCTNHGTTMPMMVNGL